jgi:hypothetical protein
MRADSLRFGNDARDCGGRLIGVRTLMPLLMQSAQERSAGKDHNPLRLGSLRYRLTETSYRKAWRAVIEIAIRGVGDPEQHPVEQDVQKLHIPNRFKLRAVLDFVAVGASFLLFHASDSSTPISIPMDLTTCSVMIL